MPVASTVAAFALLAACQPATVSPPADPQIAAVASQPVPPGPTPNASTASPPSATAERAPQEPGLRLMAVGDVMLGSTFGSRGLPADDAAGSLTAVRPLLASADIAFGNLEGPMLEGGMSSKCGANSTRCFAFRVPTRYGRYLQDTGFDVMSLANNHAGDFGQQGRDSTVRVLSSLGIAHAGADRTDVARLTVEGKRVAVVAFAHNPISLNVNDLEAARAAVQAAARDADIVVVSFHGGAEGSGATRIPQGREIFLGEQRGDLRAFVRTVVDAGADLVLGHGPHVLRGMEVYRGRLAVYSLGNFATHGFNLSGPLGEAAVLEVNLADDGALLRGRIHSTVQRGQGVELDPTGSAIATFRRLSDADFGAAAPRIAEDGTLSPPG